LAQNILVEFVVNTAKMNATWVCLSVVEVAAGQTEVTAV
jgi:hypothetical protein